MLRLEFLRPTPPGLEVNVGKSEWMRVISQPAKKDAVGWKRTVCAFVLVTWSLFKQHDRLRADSLLQCGKSDLNRFRKRFSAADGAGKFVDQSSERYDRLFTARGKFPDHPPGLQPCRPPKRFRLV